MSSLGIYGVTKTFGASAADRALDDVTIEVAAGELLVLLGPSGSGKTTLLRAIAGLLAPTGGRIVLDEVTVYDADRSLNVPPNRRNFGMVFQNFALWPHMTVSSNVAYPLSARKWPREKISPRVAEMLKLVHCSHLAERLPGTLSGGQQQRIALARALASEPALVLFDEPLSSLDALLREDLRRQLRAIHRETKFTGVYVTHDQTEAMSLGTRVAVMNAGRVEQIGTPPQIYGEPASEFVAAFMGMSNVIDGPGQAGKIRFRPEDVTVSFAPMSGIPDTECQRIVVPAKVLDCAFQGEWTECSLESDRGPIKAKVPVQSQSFTAGDSVLVAVAVEKARRF